MQKKIKKERKKVQVKRVKQIISLLRKEIGKTTTAVHSKNPFKVLIATLLSQRTKDINTEKAVKNLFSRFNSIRDFLKADIKEIEKLIRCVGFFKVKAKRIKKLAKIIHEKYHDKVPKDFDRLVKLPGVGRKTANCVLVYGYRIPAIPVDTHVHKISNRLGLVKTKTPEQTEMALKKVVPKEYWIELNELMVKFGQRKCLPRNPKCSECSLKKICAYKKARK